ncbi:MAG: ABC transporter ATP-binding protein [Bifidobacteriaceae bacterium]|nr:ABC transporter ATP-binding protein [Bifidobacteriaceae bacterium]
MTATPRVVIETQGLGWRYDPSREGQAPVQALRGVDMQIHAGEFVGLVGATGAGKSTLCMALTGIVPSLAEGRMNGVARVMGMDTREHSVAELSSQVGYVQQDPESQLFCASVEDELAFPLESRGVDPAAMDAMIDEALAAVGMGAFRDRQPSQLSGGQMQRVAIAAALVSHPDVLVLDEPTAALDPEGRREVMAALDSIRRRAAQQGRPMTIVMAEQHTECFLGRADRIVFLDGGRIAADGGMDVFDVHRDDMAKSGVAQPQGAEPAIVLEQDGGANHADTASHTGAGSGRSAIIEFTHLTYRYPNASAATAPALDDVSLAIPRGAFVGLVGRNGSGKTTLVRHLDGLLKATSGTVRVDGLDPARHSVGRMARHVGFVFQNPDHQIFCSTVRDEIGYGPKALGVPASKVAARTDELLEALDLRDVAAAPPATLDYGTRRAVALASVLAMRTPVLVLDEPTACLDANLSERFLSLVADANAHGTTVIMISHDLRAVARHCTHLLRMDGGHVARWGAIDREATASAASAVPAVSPAVSPAAQPVAPPVAPPVAQSQEVR